MRVLGTAIHVSSIIRHLVAASQQSMKKGREVGMNTKNVPLTNTEKILLGLGLSLGVLFLLGYFCAP